MVITERLLTNMSLFNKLKFGGDRFMPKISYVISTYNAGDYLDRCIRDLTNQSMQDFEIVIINPNSPDKDGEVAERWMQKDSRIVYLYQDKREPYGQSWLRGWKAASAPYACNANTDDKRHPLLGEKLYRAAEAAGKKIGFIYAGIEVVDEGGRHITGGERQPFDREVFKRECHAGPSVMWRKEILDEIDWALAWHRASILTSAFDYWMWLKMMSLGYDGLNVYGCPVTYAQREASIEHSAGMASTWQTLSAIAEFFPESLKTMGDNAQDFLDWPHVPPCDEWCDAIKAGKKWYGAKIKKFLTEQDMKDMEQK